MSDLVYSIQVVLEKPLTIQRADQAAEFISQHKNVRSVYFHTVEADKLIRKQLIDKTIEFLETLR